MTTTTETTKKTRLQREKELYPPIWDYFIRKGYTEFCIGTNHEGDGHFGVNFEPDENKEDKKNKGWIKPDILVFKIENGIIETIAVEAKPGKGYQAAADALSQAIRYLPFFDKVYIATEKGHPVPHLNESLKRLGIGYIVVDKSEGKAEEIPDLSAENKGFKEDELFNKYVKPRILMRCAFQRIFPNPKHGNENAGNDWLAINTDEHGEVQYNTHYKPEKNISGDIWRDIWHEQGTGPLCNFGINIGKKGTTRNIFHGLNAKSAAEEIWNLLKNLPDGYGITLTKAPPNKRGIKGEPIAEFCKLVKNWDCQKVSEFINKIQAILNERSVKPHLFVGRTIWRDPEPITEQELVKRMNETKSKLEPLMTLFKKWLANGMKK